MGGKLYSFGDAFCAGMLNVDAVTSVVVRGVHVRTGVMETGLGGGLSVICAEGTIFTLGVNAVGVSFGTLGEGAG